MESAHVTAGFVSGLRSPLFTSDLVKTEQVQRNLAQEHTQKKKTRGGGVCCFYVLCLKNNGKGEKINSGPMKV